MIRVIELFSGIGSQRMALKNLGIEHEVVAISEIDKYALKSYESIHDDCPNLGDISKIKIEDIPEHDLLTYSFPCQDISVAGRGKGLSEESGTRSSLLWECKRVIEGKKPSYLLLENVKNLVGKKNKPDFDKWLEWLEGQGYRNYWKVLNAKYYHVPQNRERVFVVSIRNDIEIDYVFPNNDTVTSCIKDILETSVEDKFYLSDEQVSKFKPKNKNGDIKVIGNTSNTGYGKSDVHEVDGISPTIAARDYKGANQIIVEGSTSPTGHWCRDVMNTEGISRSLMAHDRFTPKQILVEGNLERDGWHEISNRVYNSDGSSPTLAARSDSPKILEEFYVSEHAEKKIRERLGDKEALVYNWFNDIPFKEDETIGTVTTSTGSWTGKTGFVVIRDKPYRIRKLSPRECWRLMSFSDSDFDKAQKVNSNSQLYKQAGNSICVSVLEAIFKNLFIKE